MRLGIANNEMLFEVEFRGFADILRPFVEDRLGESVEQLKQFFVFGQHASAVVGVLGSEHGDTMKTVLVAYDAYG